MIDFFSFLSFVSPPHPWSFGKYHISGLIEMCHKSFDIYINVTLTNESIIINKHNVIENIKKTYLRTRSQCFSSTTSRIISESIASKQSCQNPLYGQSDPCQYPPSPTLRGLYKWLVHFLEQMTITLNTWGL